MKQGKIKVALIGGTGKAGRYLVKQLISEGYSIRVLVRNQERLDIKHSAIDKIVLGDVSQPECIESLIHGCKAVISTLGLGDPPSQPTIFSLAAKNIIKAMNQAAISRYIVITGLNVDTRADKKGAVTKSATEWMYTNYPRSTRDKQLEYELLLESNLDWTLVRLPFIEETDIKKAISVSTSDCPGDRISATSLAVFLREQLNSTAYIKQSPFVSNA
ncbi:MAG TPA: NAD(P)H-binding protein [Chryseosolibacter sp.]|nr:NAD(P)H-binding protein [Chryseosolibacter sp.]